MPVIKVKNKEGNWIEISYLLIENPYNDEPIKALITTLQNGKANKSDLNNYATKAELGLINTVLDEING